MDKVMSARVDETVIFADWRSGQQLNTSKKIIENAVEMYVRGQD